MLSPLTILMLVTVSSNRDSNLRENTRLEGADSMAAYTVVDLIDRVRDIGYERVEVVHTVSLPPLAGGYLGPHVVGCLHLVAGPNIRWRALDHIQMLSPLGHLWDDLHSRRSRPDDGDPLVAEIDHVRLLLTASYKVPIPAGRVHDGLALAKLVKTGKLRDVRRREGACCVHDELGAQGDVLALSTGPTLSCHAHNPSG